MIIENPTELQSWLVKVLATLSEANPDALSKYVLALIKKDNKSENELKKICVEQLDVFLQEETDKFVNTLFEVIKTKSYSLLLKDEKDKNKGKKHDGGSSDRRRKKYDRESSATTDSDSDSSDASRKSTRIVSPEREKFIEKRDTRQKTVQRLSNSSSVGESKSSKHIINQSSMDNVNNKGAITSSYQTAPIGVPATQVKSSVVKPINAISYNHSYGPATVNVPSKLFGEPISNTATGNIIRKRSSSRHRPEDKSQTKSGDKSLSSHKVVSSRDHQHQHYNKNYGYEKDQSAYKRQRLSPQSTAKSTHSKGYADERDYGKKKSSKATTHSHIATLSHTSSNTTMTSTLCSMQSSTSPQNTSSKSKSKTTNLSNENEQSLPTQSTLTSTGPPPCRDYNEKGFCMLGDRCPFSHGKDAVILSDLNPNPNNNNQINANRSIEATYGAVPALMRPPLIMIRPPGTVSQHMGAPPLGSIIRNTTPGLLGPSPFMFGPQQHPEMLSGGIRQPSHPPFINAPMMNMSAEEQQKQRSLVGNLMIPPPSHYMLEKNQQLKTKNEIIDSNIFTNTTPTLNVSLSPNQSIGNKTNDSVRRDHSATKITTKIKRHNSNQSKTITTADGMEENGIESTLSYNPEHPDMNIFPMLVGNDEMENTMFSQQNKAGFDYTRLGAYEQSNLGPNNARILANAIKNKYAATSSSLVNIKLRPMNNNFQAGLTGKSHLRGMRNAGQRENKTLEIRKIPVEMNTISQLNGYFQKFGQLVNIQVNHNNDPRAALVTFSTNAEAYKAYKCQDPIFNNRFVRVFWYKGQHTNTNAQSADDDVLTEDLEVKGENDHFEGELRGVQQNILKNGLEKERANLAESTPLPSTDQLKLDKRVDLNKTRYELLIKRIENQKSLIEKMAKKPELFSGSLRATAISTMNELKQSVDRLKAEMDNLEEFGEQNAGLKNKKRNSFETVELNTSGNEVITENNLTENSYVKDSESTNVTPTIPSETLEKDTKLKLAINAMAAKRRDLEKLSKKQMLDDELDKITKSYPYTKSNGSHLDEIDSLIQQIHQKSELLQNKNLKHLNMEEIEKIKQRIMQLKKRNTSLLHTKLNPYNRMYKKSPFVSTASMKGSALEIRNLNNASTRINIDHRPKAIVLTLKPKLLEEMEPQNVLDLNQSLLPEIETQLRLFVPHNDSLHLVNISPLNETDENQGIIEDKTEATSKKSTTFLLDFETRKDAEKLMFALHSNPSAIININEQEYMIEAQWSISKHNIPKLVNDNPELTLESTI